ncbi:hypothetical protein R1sor_018731 [Riccia sorocarpa]|uniref:Uncharacterized protein n=1 Tax=Riccia sorocarpa TaxID=122646 RepID=A0ABD3IDU6_9MARC
MLPGAFLEVDGKRPRERLKTLPAAFWRWNGNAAGGKRKGKDPVPQEEAEEGELLPGVPLSEPAKQHRSGPSQDIATKDERLRENAEMRHAWFKWFTSEEDLDKCRKEFWTPGSEAGRQHFQGKLIELGLEAYIAAAMDANRVGFSTSVLGVHERWRHL